MTRGSKRSPTGFPLKSVGGVSHLDRLDRGALCQSDDVRNPFRRLAADALQAERFADAASFVLYDAKAPATLLPGGNGMALDWSLLENVKSKDFMLAGGLDPGNVGDAIRATGAGKVDVSSGVESSPGVKDLTLIRKFIEAAKSAS
jgi:phosphoribosylanthranilate isomerase